MYHVNFQWHQRKSTNHINHTKNASNFPIWRSAPPIFKGHLSHPHTLFTPPQFTVKPLWLPKLHGTNEQTTSNDGVLAVWIWEMMRWTTFTKDVVWKRRLGSCKLLYFLFSFKHCWKLMQIRLQAQTEKHRFGKRKHEVKWGVIGWWWWWRWWWWWWWVVENS